MRLPADASADCTGKEACECNADVSWCADVSWSLSVVLLIDSGLAVTGCPREWCPTAGENETMEHFGEKDVLFTTAGQQSMEFGFQVCNVRFPNVSVYRLTQAGCKPEVDDSMAHLSFPEKGTLDLDLIGGTLWLALWILDRSFTVQTG